MEKYEKILKIDTFSALDEAGEVYFVLGIKTEVEGKRLNSFFVKPKSKTNWKDWSVPGLLLSIKNNKYKAGLLGEIMEKVGFVDISDITKKKIIIMSYN